MTETSEMAPDITGKIAEAVKKRSTEFLIWLLCTLSVSAIAYIYVGSALNGYAVFASAMAAGCIGLFNILRTKKLGGLAYFGIMMIVCVICLMIAGTDLDSAYAFIRWFFSGAQAEDTRVNFMFAVTVFMSFFFTSALYYFSKIIYRSAMLTLISLIPFALAAKANMLLPAAYYMIIASLNLIMLVSDGRSGLLKGKMRGGGSAGVVYTDFILAAILLSLIIPKPQETPFYEKFEAFSNRFSFGGSGEAEYRGEYKTESGNADDLVRGESKLIYILQTTDAEYMKAQIFDLYIPEDNRWKSMDKNVMGRKDWADTAGYLNYKMLETAIEAAAEADPEFYLRHPSAQMINIDEDPLVYSLVYARDYQAQYVIAPMRAVSADLSAVNGAEYCARSESGEMFSNVDMPENAVYSFRYYSDSTPEMLMEEGFCDVSVQEYRRMLNDALDLTEDPESKKVLKKFIDEVTAAEEYRSDTHIQVSAQVQALADEITDGLKYDYEKARAIEQYFHTGRFIYNLNYKPPAGRDTVEYFLFDSRTGICGDFATAYTVLARAAGLTVRYAEGFVPQSDKTEQNMITHYIFTDNAHAYPEVYIPGAGWVVFEPTAGNFLGNSGNENQGGAAIDYTAVLLTAGMYVIGLGIFVILLILRPKIAESFFRMRAKRTGGGKAVIMLYNRHIRNAEKRLGRSLKAFTPEQTAEATEEYTGISLAPITEPFTAVCYGGGDVGKQDFAKAYGCYKEQAKALGKRKRRDRK